MIFVLFSPQTQFLAQFFYTQKRISSSNNMSCGEISPHSRFFLHGHRPWCLWQIWGMLKWWVQLVWLVGLTWGQSLLICNKLCTAPSFWYLTTAFHMVVTAHILAHTRKHKTHKKLHKNTNTHAQIWYDNKLCDCHPAHSSRAHQLECLNKYHIFGDTTNHLRSINDNATGH